MRNLSLYILLCILLTVPVSAQDPPASDPSKPTETSNDELSQTNDANVGEPTSFWPSLFKHNPGVVTTLLTAVLVPVVILWLTNRNNRKIKDMEHNHAIEMEKQKKDIELANKNKSTKREYENTVHACLVKILFAVQQLHVDLSRDCSQIEVTNQASEKFSSTLNEYQQKIADNQISLSAKNNTSIYTFYQLLSEMLIELKSLCANNNGDLAQVSVYEHAKRLADEVITLQENILRERKELAADFDRAQLEKMRHCCGSQPSPELLARYNRLREQVAEIPADLPMQLASAQQPVSDDGQSEE